MHTYVRGSINCKVRTIGTKPVFTGRYIRYVTDYPHIYTYIYTIAAIADSLMWGSLKLAPIKLVDVR